MEGEVDQVTVVATWIGLLSSVVSIVLSIVAIVFARDVDLRSAQVTSHTIQSLQKIESQVERTSQDTSGLIKIAWDRMLSGVPPQESGTPHEGTSVQELTDGVLTEMRRQLEEANISAEKVEHTMESLVDTVMGLQADRPPIRDKSSTITLTATFDAAMQAIDGLEPVPSALLQAIAHGPHLSRPQYMALLSKPSISGALRVLRRRGLLEPVRSKTEDEVVYWLPPWYSDVIGPLLQLVNDPDEHAFNTVGDALIEIGYMVPDDGDE
jgi:hypothetical protein